MKIFFLTLLAGFALVATSLGQPGGPWGDVCSNPSAQTLAPVDLDVGTGQVDGCEHLVPTQARTCHLSAVLECDGLYVWYWSATEVDYRVSFVAGPMLASGFSIVVVSWDPDGWFPGTESIFVKNQVRIRGKTDGDPVLLRDRGAIRGGHRSGQPCGGVGPHRWR